MAATAGAATFAAGAAASQASLASDVASLLMVGFAGPRADSPSVQRLAHHIRQGRVGSVFFVRDNVGSNRDLKGILATFRNARSDLRLAIDHEGGDVQRLLPIHGCRLVPKPIDIPSRMTAAEAFEFYKQIGAEFAATGFNINLAPVVDIHSPGNPAIAKYGRAFSDDPHTIITYARAFIEGFQAARIACALKHFPGYSASTDDNHDVLPDISKTWSQRELAPFSALMASGHARLVMGTHLRLATLDPDLPTTLSPRVTTELLRGKMGFQGVIMTDDIDMAALTRSTNRKAAFIAALAAGNDLVMVRNVTDHDPDFPARAARWVEEAIADGKLSRQHIAASARRVEALAVAT